MCYVAYLLDAVVVRWVARELSMVHVVGYRCAETQRSGSITALLRHPECTDSECSGLSS